VQGSRPAAFPNLEVKYVRGADPELLLMDGSGEVKERLAIDKWNTDSVEEFLETYLLPPGEGGEEEGFDGEDNEV